MTSYEKKAVTENRISLKNKKILFRTLTGLIY
jgi:hypothetical protein